MYTLGCNIRRFIHSESKNKREKTKSNFRVVTLNSNCHKKNSMFNRKLHELKSKVEIDIDKASLVGIETWSDALSEILIEHDNEVIIKHFNSNLAFNEIHKPIPTKFEISSRIGKSSNATEPSVNVTSADILKDYAKISSLLFLNHIPQFSFISSGGRHISLDFLIPKLEPFSGGVARFINKNIPFVTNDLTADYLRDAALRLEDIDIKLSFQLMKIAHEIRPKGPLIKKKKEEYKKKIQKIQKK